MAINLNSGTDDNSGLVHWYKDYLRGVVSKRINKEEVVKLLQQLANVLQDPEVTLDDDDYVFINECLLGLSDSAEFARQHHKSLADIDDSGPTQTQAKSTTGESETLQMPPDEYLEYLDTLSRYEGLLKEEP